MRLMDIRREAVRTAIRIGEPDGRGPIVAAARVLGERAFAAVPGEVREARRWLRTLLGDRCPDARVCLSEIFTNSVRHSRSGRRREAVSVTVLEVGHRIRVEVSDAGGDTEPRLLAHDEDAVDGRGLRLVDELTGGRWGSRSDERHRTVWFEFPYIPEKGNVDGTA